MKNPRLAIAVTLTLGFASGCSFLRELFAEPPIEIDLDVDVELPAPTGDFFVGRASFEVVDVARLELFQRPADAAGHPYRQWMIQIYYPAAVPGGAVPSPYIEDAVLKAELAERLVHDGDPRVLDRIHSHSHLDAPVDRRRAPYPVLLFSSGGGIQPQLYAAMLEELASSGFVVVNVNDTHDAPVTVFPDGYVAINPMNPRTGKLYYENRFMKDYLSKKKEAVAAYDHYMKTTKPRDIVFTADVLEGWNAPDSGHVLAEAMDMESVAVFGHSWGGAASTQAVLDDPRFAALAVLDSDVFLIVDEGSVAPRVPVMYSTSSGLELSAADKKENAVINAKVARFLSGAPVYCWFEVEETAHLYYVSDVLLIEPYNKKVSRDERLVRSISESDAFAYTCSYLSAFFGHHLKGEESPLLEPSSIPFPQVALECSF